jgi:hypothetical protein
VTYTDANICHDILTGISGTGILHLCGKKLIFLCLERLETVEIATFGSEFTATRIAVDQIIDSRKTLRYHGVTVSAKIFMFGDNQSLQTAQFPILH